MSPPPKKQAKNGLQSQSYKNGSVALWIEIAVILNWRYRLNIWYGLVWFGMELLVYFGMGGGQMTTSEFIHEEISIMDYNRLS